MEKDLLPLKWLKRKQSTAFTHLRSRKDDSRTLSTSFTVELKGTQKKQKKRPKCQDVVVETKTQ